MKKTQKRAFILSECKSPYISQAIFILRDGVEGGESGVIADAERIVAAYMSGSNLHHEPKKQTYSAAAFFSVLAVALCACAACVYMLL